MLELKSFSNTEKSFVFCDFDWQKTIPYSDAAVSFLEHNEIYVWECGFPAPERIIETYLLGEEEFTRQFKLGSSSFVLYDANNEIIIAARDFMGNFPLYYHQNNNSFIFSFSMNALLQAKLFKFEINYSKVVEYIECDLYRLPNNQTFYHQVYRLLPAYLLQIKQGKVRELRRYGKFNLLKYRNFNDEQFIGKFRELFAQSVEKNTKYYKKIAATLSGGLDSSSVCSVAQSLRKEPINTFNFKPPTAETQEDEFIEAMQNKWQIKHRTVSPTYSEYNASVNLIAQNVQPIFVFNSTIQLDLIDAAKSTDCDVFLSGHWGDLVVGYGIEYLEELVRKKDWAKLNIAIRQLFQPSSTDLAETYQNKINIYIRKLLLKNKHWSELPEIIWILFRRFNYGFRDIFEAIQRKVKTQLRSRFNPQFSGLIRAEVMSKKVQIESKKSFEILKIAETINAPASAEQKRQLSGIFRGNQTYGQEEYFEIYRRNSMRSVQPFFDAELIELNLSVPLRLKFGEGLKRGTIRKALQNYLPEKIAKRTTKADFSAHYLNLFKDLWQDFTANTPENHTIWKIVNKEIVEKTAATFFDENEIANKIKLMVTLKRIIFLSIWLDVFENVLS